MFPVWAGMSLPQALEIISKLCVPRMGGDEPEAGDIAPVEPTCSPYGRG